MNEASWGKHRYCHPYFQYPATISHQVLPEQYIPFLLPVRLERGQGFAVGTALASLRVDGGQDAALTRFEHTKLHFADTNALPAVFGKGFAPLHHQVGTKAQHLHRSTDPLRQVIERCLADQQQGKTVGKGHPITVEAIAIGQIAGTLLRHMDQAHLLANEFTEPLRRFVTGIRHAQRIAPDQDTTQIAIAFGHRHMQRRTPCSVQDQPAVFGTGRRQLAHLRIGALGQEASVVALHQHPATVCVQPQHVQRGRVQRLGACGLERVAVQSTQTHF